MENASDALIMAGEMLIFIVALTVCISSFTKVRVEIDKIVGQKETVQMAKNEENQEYVNYIKSKKNNSIRVVGAETLLPSLYRAIKENYVIYIKLAQSYGEDELKEYGIVMTTADKTITVTDPMNESERKNIIENGDKLIKVTIGSKTAKINQDISNILSKDDAKFYKEFIKGKKFYEYLGEYQDWAEPGVSSEDRTVHRIITYIAEDALT